MKVQIVIDNTTYTADCADKEQLTQVLSYMANTIDSAKDIREAKHKLLVNSNDLPIHVK